MVFNTGAMTHRRELTDDEFDHLIGLIKGVPLPNDRIGSDLGELLVLDPAWKPADYVLGRISAVPAILLEETPNRSLDVIESDAAHPTLNLSGYVWPSGVHMPGPETPRA